MRVRVSLATIIAISSLLKESSDGFDHINEDAIVVLIVAKRS